MSQLVSFDNPRKPQELTKTRLTFDTSSNALTTSSITALFGFLLESYSKSFQPVRVVSGAIKVKEYLMEENKPYAFQYNDKDYVITKTVDKIKLYELRDQLSDDSFSPFKLLGKLGYEHSNKKKHLVFEYRTNELEICKPKHIPTKEHWYSKEKTWLVHYRDDGEPDIRLLE